MATLIGITLALGVGGFARLVGLDRDRAFYPTVMIVIASLYVLFAAAGGLTALPVEMSIGAAFIIVATVGFKKSPWLVVVALVAHGIFDLFHPHVVENGGVPLWWPEFCSAYDITAGAWLAWLILRARRDSSPRSAVQTDPGETARSN